MSAFKKALAELDPIVIANGFQKSRLSPFNPGNVDYTKCVMTKTNPPQLLDGDYVNDSYTRYFESKMSPNKLKAFRENKGTT